jgi:hypothetical protein
MLDGKKSYLCGLVGLLVIGLQAAGILTDEAAKYLLEAVGATGIMALRNALPKK